MLKEGTVKMQFNDIRDKIKTTFEGIGFLGTFIYFNDQTKFNLYCNEDACSRHIRKFLEPYYSFTKEQPSDESNCFNIKAVIAPSIVAEVKEFVQDGERVAVKLPTLKRFDTYSRKKTDGVIQIFWVEDANSVFMLEDNNIYVVAVNEGGLNINAIRIIRDITQLNYQNNGGIFFHATAFSKNNDGVAILGDKGSGKTTLLFRYILENGYHTLSLDRMFLKLNNSEVDIMGWPNSLNLGLGTIRAFCNIPSMNELLNQNNEERYKAFDSVFQWKDKDKIHLNPYEVEFIKRQGSSKLKAILFPTFIAEGEASTRRLGREEIINKLDESCFSPYDPNFKNWHSLVNVKEEECRENIEELYNFIIQNIPCYEMYYTPESDLIRLIG